MRILFALAGLHRVDRGAEIAFMSIAAQLARQGEEVTLIGSGPDRRGSEYRYIQVGSMRRETFERWPALPMFRNETAWEEASFACGLLRAYRPWDYDVTLACSYPWTNLALRRPAAGGRPPHVFVTQNGDWPAHSDQSEFRLFGCDGLVCINPDYFERNRNCYRSALIPNGVDTARFSPGPPDRERLGIPTGARVVLMVSAFIPSKNVHEAINAVARLPETILVVAGDGPLREEMRQLAERHIPGRYMQLTLAADEMPSLYRSADVFLHLSRDESFGNVYVEAMASGLPIVSYDLPRTRWIVGDLGHLAADRDALVVQLRRALVEGDALSGPLVARAKQFDWSSVALRYREFLDQVVEEAR